MWRRLLRLPFWGVVGIVVVPMLLCCAIVARLIGRRTGRFARLVWGSAPIVNNALWARAMRDAGWSSVSYTDGFASTINQRADYDRVLGDGVDFVPRAALRILAFAVALFEFDVFFVSFEGFFLGATPLWWAEGALLHIAGRKIVVIPFGSDAYVYRRVRSAGTAHGLMTSVPSPRRRQRSIARRVDYWCDVADVVVPGTMGLDGIGRWDVLAPSSLCLDMSQWTTTVRSNHADGRNGPVVVAHAPNFRGFKGSEFLIRAVEQLRSEGLAVELNLMEGLQNAEVRRRLREESDILVEQLIATGHGLNAIEGMATGLPVVSNLEDDSLLLHLRRWSFLDECPIASASPETIVDVLRKLVTRPALRVALGAAGRVYAEKYLSFPSAQYQFGQILRVLDGENVDLLGLYQSVSGEYPRRSPRVIHPLVRSRIPESDG